jgi:hypothetical protein
MATTDIEQDGRRTAWRNPVLRFEGSCRAPAEVVYDLLADLHSHLDWAGQRQRETTWLLTVARWSDRSVVTEATRPEVFEFVTDGAAAGEARPPPVAVHGRPPLRDRAGGGWLPGDLHQDLHRRPHPPGWRALDAADPRRKPNRVPDQRQVHAPRL